MSKRAALITYRVDHLAVIPAADLSPAPSRRVLLTTQPQRHLVDDGDVNEEQVLPLGDDGIGENLQRKRRDPEQSHSYVGSALITTSQAQIETFKSTFMCIIAETH